MTEEIISEIIHLAWCDKTSFEEIKLQFGLKEPEVKALMRAQLKPGSFRLWRKRVYGRNAKHQKKLHNRLANTKGSRYKGSQPLS